MFSKAASKKSFETGISGQVSELETSFQRPSELDTSFEKYSVTDSLTKGFEKSTSWREVLLKYGNRINQLELEVKRLREKVSKTN
jgi:hypothetical protein